jgi:pimeloyl-ACP methyl ester carboxylesterase
VVGGPIPKEELPLEATIDGIPVHLVEHGRGTPVLALHGVDVDHREAAGTLEPVFAGRPGYRRIYPDLPGMGRTPAPETVNGTDDVVELLLGLVDEVVGVEPFLVVGHSYGGYLARAIANRRPGQVAGLALICALGERVDADEVPGHVVLHADGHIDGILDPAMDAEFRGYFVVQTPETLRSFRRHVLPGMGLTDQAGLERIFRRWQLGTVPEQAAPYPNPTLILAGRQDATVGFTRSWRLLEHYPRATFAVLDRAGHALPHEQAGLFAALLGEWLDRVREAADRG